MAIELPIGKRLNPDGAAADVLRFRENLIAKSRMVRDDGHISGVGSLVKVGSQTNSVAETKVQTKVVEPVPARSTKR